MTDQPISETPPIPQPEPPVVPEPEPTPEWWQRFLKA